METLSDPEVVKVLVSLGGALLSALLALGGRLIHLLSKKAKSEYVSGVLLRARDAVTQAVLTTQQTFVDELRDENGDGKLDKAEAREAFLRTLNGAKGRLRSEGLRELTKVVGGEYAAEALLGNEIEAQLSKVKKQAR